LDVPIVVYPRPNEGSQFYESTHALVVSAHGALIALAGMVTPKQRLLVQNAQSGDLEECRVASVKNELTGPPQVAVEFTWPAPSFWDLASTPADWTASV